jgi:Tol biopolymer transport system component
MTMTRPAIIRLAVGVPLALAVLFSVPAQRGGSGTTIARAGMTSSIGADAPMHRMSNGKIAFVEYSSSNSDNLDVVNPDGSGLRILARCKTHSCVISDAVWSPDGRRIAFLRGGGSPYYSEVSVSVMNANGSGERRVASCGRSFITCWGRSLAWSPDSTRLAIARGGSLYIHDLKTGGVRRLTARATGMLGVLYAADFDPAWSPDGSRIAFARAPGGCGSACPFLPYIVNADGRGLRRLSTFYGDECCGGPLWSPDGRRIAFNVGLDARWLQKLYCRGRCPSGGIYAVNPDGSHRRRLVPAPRPGKSVVLQVLASWSPDGRHILYSRSPSASSEPQTATLWMMNANGTGQRRLYRAVHLNIGAAVWSPDGQRIVFSAFSANTLRSGLFTMGADGNHLRRLMPVGNQLAWQPIP